MKTYLVGGAVRDRLLKRPVKERDFVVVGATEGEMLARGFRRVGKDFPVFLHPETQEEYALARTERKCAPGYRGFEVLADPSVTLEDDLKRRDLTINALAEDEQGNLIDLYGGRDDLEQRVLRHISPAFSEDPVRILRLARFAARYADLGFQVADETLALVRMMVDSGEVDALVPERVWQELAGALREDTPSRFFTLLRDSGALARLFPEIDALFGVPQPEHWHPEIDTGVHTMMVVDAAARISPSPEVRFAALTHDLGKGTTPKEMLPRHRGHEDRGLLLIEHFCDRLRVPNRFRELARLVCRYHGLVHRVEEIRAATYLDILEGADAVRRPDRFELFLQACEADFRGRKGFANRAYVQADRLRGALKAVSDLDLSELTRAGGEGHSIRERIRQQRMRVIRDFLVDEDISD